MTWDLVDGAWRLFALPLVQRDLRCGCRAPHSTRCSRPGRSSIVGPGHGIWFESIIPDESGAWYGYYHHEIPAFECGRPDRSIPQDWIGALHRTAASPGRTSASCSRRRPAARRAARPNRYVIGGVGDVSAVLAPRPAPTSISITASISRVPAEQGVMVARLAWADRDEPAGKSDDLERGRMAAAASRAPTKRPLPGSLRPGPHSSRRHAAVARRRRARSTPSGVRRFTGTRTSNAT